MLCDFILTLGHDLMSLRLAAAHASIFNTTRQAFLIKSMREAFFVSFVNLYQQTFLAIFYLILVHLSMQTLTLEIHNFKPIQYTCKLNN